MSTNENVATGTENQTVDIDGKEKAQLTEHEKMKIVAQKAREILEVNYYSDIEEISLNIVEAFKTVENKSINILKQLIHDSVEDTNWVLYSSKAREVLLCSKNWDFILSTKEGIAFEGRIEKENNSRCFFAFAESIPFEQMAYWAMMSDVYEIVLNMLEENKIDLDLNDQCAGSMPEIIDELNEQNEIAKNEQEEFVDINLLENNDEDDDD